MLNFNLTNQTKTYSTTDQLLPRSLKRSWWLVAPQGIVEFKGRSIPPVLVVLNEEYTKNGKWSHTDYTVEVDTSCKLVELQQDFGTCRWFNSLTMGGVIKELREKLKLDDSHDDGYLQQFLMNEFPKTIERILNLEMEARTNSLEVLLNKSKTPPDVEKVLEKFQELHDDILHKINDKYGSLTENENKIKEAKKKLIGSKGKKLSLADLQASFK